MTMISYGQNHEDVLLNRLFAPDYRGFYVDIGANDPVNGSVTNHFYQRGWRGINVEPGAIFERLNKDRPRDVNLQVAISRTCGEAALFDYPDAAADSTLSVAVARDNERFGYTCIPRTVKVITLAHLCEQYVKDRTIDFMSIDVEGHEVEVIAGGDWARFRPRVLVIEATWPHSRQPTHMNWEPLLVAQDYRFVLFDGLNRFYLRREDDHLQEPLRAPVCIFDDYKSYAHYLDLKWHIAELEKCHAMLGSPRLLFVRCLQLLPQAVFRKARQAAALFPLGSRSRGDSGKAGSGASSQNRAA